MAIKSQTEKSNASFIAADAGLREEDGWIFRERPGLPVECVRRAAESQKLEMTPPNQNRHNYPSA